MPITQSPNHQISKLTVVPARDARVRLNDFYEVYGDADPEAARAEGARCFNCGAAFCMPDSGYTPTEGERVEAYGCPIGNLIPEWNELVRVGRWRDAYDRLSVTNPLPEFTSRVCPAPCQDACIAGINDDPIQIKGIERAIIDRAFAEGWVTPPTAAAPTGRSIAIVGSGPAGLSAADRLVRRGHAVTIYERSDRAGGLLTYGVPNMKLDQRVVDRRIDVLRAGGVRFVLDAEVGRNVDPDDLRERYDAVLLAVGAQSPRELDLPGIDLVGVERAMAYLTAATRSHLDRDPAPEPLDAGGKRVVVIGGGDTGADCVGTALRQGCTSLLNVTRRAQPPDERDADHPWPGPPDTYQLDYAHTEGDTRFGRDPRTYRVQPLAVLPDPRRPHRVGGLRVRDLDENCDRVLPAELVLVAVGFVGHDALPLADAFGLTTTRGRLPGDGHRTDAAGVYTAGDCRRGASLVVWAIREGLAAADAIDTDLAHLRRAKTA
ncbi:MAG: glutamate synthase subunit beta [Planctomycetota bacterium]